MIFGSSEYFVGKDINPAFAQPSAFAGKTEFLPNLRECVSLPTKKSEQPYLSVSGTYRYMEAVRYHF